MSTEIDANMKNHSVIEFGGGGERGTMLQITANDPGSDGEGFIQLTALDAVDLISILISFASKEINRQIDKYANRAFK